MFIRLYNGRQHVINEIPKPGSHLYTIMASVPELNSFGVEYNLCSHMIGQTMVLSYFDLWEIAPGEPLDTDQPKNHDEKTELTKYMANKSKENNDNLS